MKKKRLSLDFRISLIYLFLGGIWILLSDSLLAVLLTDPVEFTRLQMYKGWVFITLSALVIFIVLRHELRLRSITEEKLSEIHNRLAYIVATSPGIVYSFRLNPDGSTCVPFGGERLAEAYGIPEARLEEDATPFFNLVHPEDLEGLRESISDSARHLSTWRHEWRVRHPIKGEMWVEGHSVPLREPDGSTVWHGVASNITDRKQAEEALRDSAERLRLATEQANIAVWEYDFNSNSMSRSENHDRLYGLEWQSKWDINTFLNATHPEDREYSNGMIQNSVAPGGPDNYHFDFRVVFPNGSIRWLFVNGRVIERDEKGQGIRVRGTLVDVTEQKLAEAALRESESRYRNLLEIAPVGIAVHSEGKIVFTNPAGSRLLGAESGDVLFGRPISEFIHPARLKTAQARNQRMMAGEQGLYPVEEIYIRLDGTPVDVEVMATALSYQGKPAVQVIFTDITERKRAQEELRLHRDRLADLSRQLVEAHETEQRAIGRELHDQIGQMLTALKLTLEVAPQLPTELASRKLAGAQELLNELMTRVSNLSLELRPPMLDDLGLIPAIVWHVNRYQEQTGIQVEFKHSGMESRRFTSEIETTAYRIVQEALTNVARHARSARARLEVHAETHWIEICIEDDGVGFDPQEALGKHRGLSAMRERAQLVGGECHIESEEGRGTRNRIRLPLQEKIQ